MSDAQNLNDFFAQQKQRKKPTKAGAAKATPAAAAQANDKDNKKNEPVTAQPEALSTPAQDFADSSDEESNTIVINEGRKKIIDRKDLEASQKNTVDETDTVAGWGLGSKLGKVEETSSFPTTASAKGPPTGAKMNFGRPTFTRKQKGIIDTQDFPDLDSTAAAAGTTTQANTQDQQQSKANSSMQYNFGAAAKGARDPADEENKTAYSAATKPATKPVFKGKAKLNTGGASNEEVQNSRMNYDFSKMQMSAATAKKIEGAEGAEGENRPAGKYDGERRTGGERRPVGERNPRPAPTQAPTTAPVFEDDFEVVAEKKKIVRPVRKTEEPKFGGGMPSFTRGGANRQDQ